MITPLCPKCQKPQTHAGTHVATGLPVFCCAGCQHDQIGFKRVDCPSCGTLYAWQLRATAPRGIKILVGSEERGFVCQAELSDRGYFFDSNGEIPSVTHWMHMPHIVKK